MKKWLNPELQNLSLESTKDERLFECGSPVGNNLLCIYHNHFCKYAKYDTPTPYDAEGRCIDSHVVRCTYGVVECPPSNQDPVIPPAS